MAKLEPVTASQSIGPVTVRCTVTPESTRIKGGRLIVNCSRQTHWYLLGVRVPGMLIRRIVAPAMRRLDR